MRIGIGVPNTQRRVSSFVPPVPSGWLSDVISLPITTGSSGSFTTGIFFDVPTVQSCKGILVNWQNASNPTPTVALQLWSLSSGLIASQNVVVVSPGLTYTNASFGSHILSPGITYSVTVHEIAGVSYNGLVFGNPYAIPRAYPKYSVTGSYVYSFGSGIPISVNNGACALIEPVML